MSGDNAWLWTDRSCLQDIQYRTDANLAARQSIYAYQRPRLDLPPLVLDLAALRGGETVADVGCGNGAYLAELAQSGHAAQCWAWTCRPACCMRPAAAHRERAWSPGTLLPCRCAMTPAA